MVEDQQQDADFSHDPPIREQNKRTNKVAENRGAVKRERED